MKKKGFSEFLATLLLIVLLVTSIVLTQVWLLNYSSGIYTRGESKSSTSETGIERVINSKLYFNNKFTSLKITKISVDDISCSINDSIPRGVHMYDLTSCLTNNTNVMPHAVVYTNRGIYTADFYYPKTQ